MLPGIRVQVARKPRRVGIRKWTKQSGVALGNFPNWSKLKNELCKRYFRTFSLLNFHFSRVSAFWAFISKPASLLGIYNTLSFIGTSHPPTDGGVAGKSPVWRASTAAPQPWLRPISNSTARIKMTFWRSWGQETYTDLGFWRLKISTGSLICTQVCHSNAPSKAKDVRIFVIEESRRCIREMYQRTVWMRGQLLRSLKSSGKKTVQLSEKT